MTHRESIRSEVRAETACRRRRRGWCRIVGSTGACEQRGLSKRDTRSWQGTLIEGSNEKTDAYLRDHRLLRKILGSRSLLSAVYR
jgi:hypothetical protein